MRANGNWGSCQWTIAQDGTLTIYEGKAESIPSDGKAVWYEYRDQITRACFSGRVRFDEGSSLGYMFKDCSAMEEIDLTDLDTAGVTFMHSMFEGCSSLKEVDLSILDTEYVTTLNGMFNSCSSLRKVDLSDLYTPNLINMIGMFMNCSSLEEVDISSLDTSNVIDMSWLFCGCRQLKHADLSMLDTGKVMDMSCMFLNCESLVSVRIGGIDTSSLMDVSRMFMYCRKLHSLDLEDIDTSSVENGTDMLLGCDGLKALIPGERFNMQGAGHTLISLPESRRGEDTEMESDWRTSTDGVYYIAGSEFSLDYDGSGAQRKETLAEAIFEEDGVSGIPAGETVTIAEPKYVPPAGKVFKEWNTRRNGTGRALQPGDEMLVHADRTLYAIWAGEPIILRSYGVPKIVYGEKPVLTPPRIDPNNGEITSLKPQIRFGEDDDWKDYTGDEYFTAGMEGVEIRYEAVNFVGTVYTEPVPLLIGKASYDMSRVSWQLPEDLFYDGTEKIVTLTGLPEGVTCEYTGCRATEAGNYTATAAYRFDAQNYEAPVPPEPLHWTIKRGRYNMEDIGWSYLEAFTYDGENKQVRLSGLPEGTVPYYDGADAVNAGRYFATAGLDYDIDNYDKPEGIRPCIWEIRKTTHDMSGVQWEGPEAFVYDGSPKKVELSGLPEGVHVEYTGNTEIRAGRYTARAAFVLDDPVNYEMPAPVSFEWEILKADHDMSSVVWTEDSLVYDGEIKEIHAEGIPEGVDVSYEGNTAIEAGSYTARAELIVEDLNNYNPIDPIAHSWEIRKAVIDTGRMRWNYSSPYVYNGSAKIVELRNIPDLIRVEYDGNQHTEAGSYTARAMITYDEDNYEPPQVEDCEWQILPANVDLRSLQWDYDRPYTYDGSEHEVRLASCPDGVTVEYEGNTATLAGSYIAKAFLTPLDTHNYKVPEPQILRWDIRKAVFDISGIRWDTDVSRVFDGENKSVRIVDLPEGIHCDYSGNTAGAAGEYLARATFTVDDTDNFLPPDPLECSWNIAPAPIDLKGICWDYSAPFTYDGSEKCIRLTGLPEGVTAVYSGADASDAGEYAAQATLIPPEGTSFRETQILGRVWRIDKADIDVSGAQWMDPIDPVYNGRVKKASLIGLPASVRSSVAGCEAVDAGEYIARAVLTPVDPKNFNAPVVDSHTWNIRKADVDMSRTSWTGFDTFVYDGTVHKVLLSRVPGPVEAIYENNTAVDAGRYVAEASFHLIDDINFNQPEPVKYEWSVKKADIDVSAMTWSEEDSFTYDGQTHSIALDNVPDLLRVTYQGSEAVDAGAYIAAAVLTPVDEKNYNVPAVEPHRWEIRKTELDISNITWVAADKLIYDGTVKVVGLTGLPEDVEVQYENNTAVEAGTYHASAVLSTESRNYTAPQIRGCTWTIAKAVPDVSELSWNYIIDFTYDGYAKRVELMDLPEGMKAVYEGNEAIEAGTYQAKARVSMRDTTNYETVEIPPLEWNILKRDYDMSTAVWTDDSDFIYDGTVKEVVLQGLEDGLEPIYEGNTGVDAGTYTARASFLYDENNYNPPQDLEFTWQIRKAPLDVSGAEWDYDGPLRANNRVRTVSLRGYGQEKGIGRLFGKNKEVDYIGLPEGTTVRYEGNSAKEPGVYEAKAWLTIPEQPNHEVTEPVTLTWEIRNG